MSTISADPPATAAVAIPAERFAVLRGRVPVPWLLVTALAVAMAFADMFWLTSLQGAVGAIERAQGPFRGWLRDSLLVAPAFFLAVLWVFARAQRKHGGRRLRGRFRTIVATVLLVAAVGSAVGIAAVVASGAWDYHLQSELLASTASLHDHGIGAGGSTVNPAYADGGWTPEQRQTIALDVKAAAFGSGLVVITNLVVVSWVVALAGGRLDARSTRRSVPDRPADDSAGA